MAAEAAIPVRAFNVFFGLGIPAPLQTEGFGDVQLHVEWAAPTPPLGVGQQRGNREGAAQRTAPPFTRSGI